jgi:hypothetical protein
VMGNVKLSGSDWSGMPRIAGLFCSPAAATNPESLSGHGFSRLQSPQRAGSGSSQSRGRKKIA